MERRHIDFPDEATSRLLHHLDHFTGQDAPERTEQFHEFLAAIIRTHRLLPKVMQERIRIYRCLVGGSYWDASHEARSKLWSEIRTDLNEGLDQVMADSSLKVRYEPGIDRPATRGERILALCKKFNNTFGSLTIARELEREGLGTEVAWDARALQKLLSKKRIANEYQHNSEIHRRIVHIEAVAHNLHHLD